LKGKRRKHVPLRSCIACREKQPKRELIRVVCTPEGSVEIDLQGKRAGRGAYFCRRPDCWQVALQPQRLSRALKCHLSAKDTEALKAHVVLLFGGEDPIESPEVLSDEAGV
jgi:uncharacterized protein